MTIDGIILREDNKLKISGDTAAQKFENEKKGKKYIIQNCDDTVMHSINPSDNFDRIMSKPNSTYGFGNMDPSIILNKLRKINFHPSKDPAVELNEIDMRLAELESAGGTIARCTAGGPTSSVRCG